MNDIFILHLSTPNKFVVVDSEDAHKVINRNWHLSSGGYAAAHVRNGFPKILMHKIIIGNHEVLVDHKNGHRFDNRKSNLRLANSSINNHNRVKDKNTSSKYKGVHYDSSRNKWLSTIRQNGIKLNLGRFVTEESAALAYNNKAIEIYGDNASINIL